MPLSRKKSKRDTTVPAISGAFEDAVRAMLKTPPSPEESRQADGEAEGGEETSLWLDNDGTYFPCMDSRYASRLTTRARASVALESTD
jgi:hypothetical protein